VFSVGVAVQMFDIQLMPWLLSRTLRDLL